MKKSLLALVVLGLVGCGHTPVKPDTIVYVDRAVPSCTAPPVVPMCEYKVDALTLQDALTPGKVGKAYVYDMTCLRTNVLLMQEILDQYSKATQDFSAVKAKIDQSTSNP